MKKMKNRNHEIEIYLMKYALAMAMEGSFTPTQGNWIEAGNILNQCGYDPSLLWDFKKEELMDEYLCSEKEANNFIGFLDQMKFREELIEEEEEW